MAQIQGDSATLDTFAGNKVEVPYVVSINADGSPAVASATGTSRIVSAAASTNSTLAKAGAAKLLTATGYNAAASVRYLKFYDKATAPTIGTDTPVQTIALPPSATFSYSFSAYPFALGLGYGLTTGAADNDTGALTAGDVLGLNITYS